jgi:hypothetical protein
MIAIPTFSSIVLVVRRPEARCTLVYSRFEKIQNQRQCACSLDSSKERSFGLLLGLGLKEVDTCAGILTTA